MLLIHISYPHVLHTLFNVPSHFTPLLSSYIYNTAVGRKMASWNDYKYGVEMLFINLLSKSKFRTFVSLMFFSSQKKI